MGSDLELQPVVTCVHLHCPCLLYSLPLYQTWDLTPCLSLIAPTCRLKRANTPWLLICSCIMILQSHIKECKTCHLGFKFATQPSSNTSNSESTQAQLTKRLIGDCSVSSDMVRETIPTLLHAFTGVATIASCITVVPIPCHGSGKLIWHVVINMLIYRRLRSKTVHLLLIHSRQTTKIDGIKHKLLPAT